MWLTVAVVAIAQFSITYVPWLQKIFSTEAVPLLDGVFIIGVGITFFAIVEVEKQLRLRLGSMLAP